MSSDKDEVKRAFELWHAFKEEVLYRHRFNVKHEVLDHVQQVAEKCKVVIEEGKILYRARLFSADTTFLNYLKVFRSNNTPDIVPRIPMPHPTQYITSTEKSGFWGYNEKGSFVPEDNNVISDGRANPAYIKYLYTAEKPYTALVEVRPYLGSTVSVAEIRVNEPITIADFSYGGFGILDGFEQSLMYMIMDDFSTPSDSDKKSYIPCQYIAEFVKTLGVEGIKFNSSLHGAGRNVTIFNYEKCQPVGSKLYEIEDICFEAKCIAPEYTSNLMHPKLEVYKEKQFSDFIARLQNQKKENPDSQ
jgi:hypothetical protein